MTSSTGHEETSKANRRTSSRNEHQMPSNESKSGTVRSRNHEDEIRLAQNPASSTQIAEVSLLQSTQETINRIP
uniref:Uncharacterized protein n=1 Tax=Caenorhabditis japonica TaxID=281687 RepID=A0A8R1ET23_CAEJA